MCGLYLDTDSNRKAVKSLDIYETIGNLNIDLALDDIKELLLVYFMCANGITLVIFKKGCLPFKDTY